MNDIIPIEVDFAISKDNLHLLGEAHETKSIYNDNSIKHKKIWRLKEKNTQLTILLEANFSIEGHIYSIELYLFKEKKYDSFHFSYGPAWMLYQDNRISEEVWYIKGEEHREDGPAVIGYDLETGAICEQEFYIEGEQVE